MNTDAQEQERLNEVRRFLQLDFSNYSELQDIVDLAAQLCDKPIAMLTFLDENINWLKVRFGVDIDAMPRETSFCKYAVEQDEILIVPDATKDGRFINNPLVTGEPNIRFYAGVPMVLKNGLKLGILCLFDVKPNHINTIQQKVLIVFAKQATLFLESELDHQVLKRQIEEIDAKNQALRKIAYMQSHEIRQPLTSVIGLVNLIRNGHHAVDEEWLNMIFEATRILDDRIKAIVAQSISGKDLKAIHFHKIVEEIEDYAILLLDAEGNIENWNKGAEIMKGYTADEVIGRNFSMFYSEENRVGKYPEQLIAQAITNGTAKDVGWRIRKDGSKFWGSVTITAIYGENEEVIGFTKVTRDLTSVNKPERLR